MDIEHWNFALVIALLLLQVGREVGSRIAKGDAVTLDVGELRSQIEERVSREVCEAKMVELLHLQESAESLARFVNSQPEKCARAFVRQEELKVLGVQIDNIDKRTARIESKIDRANGSLKLAP
ncbi:MAG: hypothetical protein WC291_12485 [Thermodesulfovibrionales bacterium]|jgi:uncharacterized small protein (DUF1192 family)